jgi:ATP-binding cassette subfamily F protein uup
VGPNGCGKSTLIKLFLGQLTPTSGVVKSGSKLEVAYFDQHRDQLDGELKVIDAIADGRREVTINGKTKHVMSYLQDYLFTPERVNSPVRSLSGGEKNRLLLAKLMLRPSNILILDEPTNDLDVETLELLEDTICNYPGTVILVSHDREFVDNVVTSSYFFEGNGKVREFVGGCTDISDWYAQQSVQKVAPVATKSQTQSPKNSLPEVKGKKLSYKLQLELESLPLKIETLENQVNSLQELVNAPNFFTQGTSKSDPVLADLAETEKLLNESYERWDEIEAMKE